jgi:hypothetical protein
MGATADNDYCPNCGSIHCSAACYYGDADSDAVEVKDKRANEGEAGDEEYQKGSKP